MPLETIIWPSTLPQSPLINTTRIAPLPNKIATDSDVGRPAQRQRYPTGYYMIESDWLMTNAQLQTLETFYWTQCVSGTRSFWHRDWRLLDTVQFFWAPEDAMGIGEASPVGWQVTMRWMRRRQ